MSLPFSRFGAIKGLSKSLACPTLGPSFWGAGAIAMRCSPRVNVKPHWCHGESILPTVDGRTPKANHL